MQLKPLSGNDHLVEKEFNSNIAILSVSQCIQPRHTTEQMKPVKKIIQSY